ncbi:MAG: GNAT family N-acetyltransferase [Dokdonella sp.]
MTDLLADIAVCPGADSMVILHGATPIGYYRIDPHSRSVAGHDFEVPALGMRAFFIDIHWQGRGFGTQALRALIADLGRRYPEARLLVLAVNVSNTAALQLYQRAGFTGNGELYHGGRAGPQQLLRRTLP